VYRLKPTILPKALEKHSRDEQTKGEKLKLNFCTYYLAKKPIHLPYK